MAGTYYGGLNWVILFVFSGLMFTYCIIYQVYPRFIKFRHFMFKRRVNAALDAIDMTTLHPEDRMRDQQVDEETGELYWVEDRLIGQSAANELLPAEGVGSSVLMSRESKYEGEGPEGIVSDRRRRGDVAQEALGEASIPRKCKEKRRDKPMSPKRLAQLEAKREEQMAHEEACRRALYVPLREEKLKIVRDSFEKWIEGGNMGWQITVEHKNRIGHDVIDGMQLRDGRVASFFHQLTFTDKMERGRPKARHRPRDMKKNPDIGRAASMGREGSCGAQKQSPPRQRSPSPVTSPRTRQSSPDAEAMTAKRAERIAAEVVRAFEREALTISANQSAPVSSPTLEGLNSECLLPMDKLKGRVVPVGISRPRTVG